MRGLAAFRVLACITAAATFQLLIAVQLQTRVLRVSRIGEPARLGRIPPWGHLLTTYDWYHTKVILEGC